MDGAIVLDEGAGGGGGGEGGGESGGGDVDEELPLGGADEGGDQGGEDDHHADDDAAGDKRQMPLDIRKAVREITTQNPDFLKRFPKFEKDITGALFTRQQVESLGGLRSISDVFEKLETYGGIDGIEEMAEDAEASKQLEQGLERGDPAVLAGWAKDYPDGFKRSAIPMLETLEKTDEERFEHVSSWLLSKVFEKFGVFSVASALGKSLSDNKPEDAVKHFNELARFLSDARGIAAKAKSDPYASRSAELDNREKKLDETDQQNFRAIVRSEVNGKVTSELNRQLREHLRTLKVFKVESGTANRMRKEINRELQRLVNTDSEYQRRYESVMTSKDRDRAANYVIKAAFRKLPEAIKGVVKDFNLRPSARPGGGGPRRRAAGGSGGDGNNSNSISGVPKTSDVDFTRTPMSTFLATRGGHGTAHLKNGKVAKW
jgi:hypothetical protein